MALRKGFLMESLKKPKAPKGASNKGETTERLTLQKAEQGKLDRWIKELNERFEGMIKLTKSDLANFLIRHHADALTENEILKIEAEHFDELRWMNWALNQIRTAKKLGQVLTLQDLMAKRLLQPSIATKTSKRKRGAQAPHNESTSPVVPTDAVESAASEDIKGS